MAKMSPHVSYMEALQLMAEQSGRDIANLMPHLGERGRIAEEIIKGVLSKTLPKRFSIGTGVIISADGKISRQTDIVIYDHFFNSPLLGEFSSCVFPVESVFATLEVKTVLTKKELVTSLEGIRQIRRVGKSRHYVVSAASIENNIAKLSQFKAVATVPPRSYIVAFSARGLGQTYDEFCDKLKSCLDETNMHVHGVCILKQNWFAGRRPFLNPAELFGRSGNALFDLYATILKHQQNFSVHPMDLDSYLSSCEGE